VRLEIDSDACTGHGRCWSLSPDVYECDDDGYCLDPSGEVPAALEASARRGAENCPEGAIRVIEG
jgi:ferredoxin